MSVADRWASMLIVGLVVAPSLGAHGDKAYLSWQGEWRINVAESHYPAGVPPIHDHILQVTKDDGKALSYTDNFTIGDNPRSKVSFDGAWDGKPYKTSDGQMMAFTRTANGYKDHWTAPIGTKGKDSCEFSTDGKKLTCHGAFTAPGAKEETTFIEVWDRFS